MHPNEVQLIRKDSNGKLHYTFEANQILDEIVAPDDLNTYRLIAFNKQRLRQETELS